MEQEVRIVKNPLLRLLFLIMGFLFMILAFFGAILPVLPTTPFLLGSAFFFYRSSSRFYRWIMYNRFFGHYLRDYKAGRGIPLRVKLMALGFTWTSTLVSVIFFIPFLWLSILVISINVAITIHLAMVGTRK